MENNRKDIIIKMQNKNSFRYFFFRRNKMININIKIRNSPNINNINNAEKLRIP